MMAAGKNILEISSRTSKKSEQMELVAQARACFLPFADGTAPGEVFTLRRRILQSQSRARSIAQGRMSQSRVRVVSRRLPLRSPYHSTRCPSVKTAGNL